MEKHFANYNQSLALKELGFDEPCLGTYDTHKGGEWLLNIYSGHLNTQFSDRNKACIAPLKSQVFEWFRTEHNLKGFIEPVEYLDDTHETYMWFVYNECHSGVKQLTFEEAETACIDKLIEIVKNR